MGQNIRVVWFKRDLRLDDHAPLKAALDGNLPVLLLYLWEPSILELPQYSEQHWQFVNDSLDDLDLHLFDRGTAVLSMRREALSAFKALHKRFGIAEVFSHAETGLFATYQRDIALAAADADGEFGVLGFEELASCGGGEEEFPYFNGGAAGSGRGLQLTAAAIQQPAVGVTGVIGSCQYRHFGDGADGRRNDPQSRRHHRSPSG